MRNALIVSGFLALALSVSAGGADAATKCKDDKGKFIKCPAAAAAKPLMTVKADAKPTTKCKDEKGKFIKCAAAEAPPAVEMKTAPTAPAHPANNHCRDIKTKKFAKCSAPGTEPVPMKAKS